MGDSSDIERIFQHEIKLPKYKTKRWVIVPDSNKGNYNYPIKYECREHKDKLVAYHNGYIKVKGHIKSTTATDIQGTDNIAFKNGNYCIIEDCHIKIEGQEIDHLMHTYLAMTVLNLFEYSNDYGISIAESYGFAKDNKNVVTDNTGHTKRKLFLGAFATDRFSFTLKIPTAHLSTFFRRLDFPLINHTVEIAVNTRKVNCLLRANAVQQSNITIETTELVLPVVELPAEYEVKFMNKLSSKSFPMTLDWDELKVHEVANTLSGQVNYELANSAYGVNRLYVLAILEDNWGDTPGEKQTHVDTFINTTLSNINVVIDGEQFYQQNIDDDDLAHELVKECFNNGGIDNDRGTCLTYVEWKTCYKIYAFDLSRQKVLESDPRKAQSIRFRCTLPAGNYKVIFIVSSNKQTKFDFCNTYNLKNI